MSPENANIFQADDDSGWFRTLKRQLEKCGHRVVIQVMSPQEVSDEAELARKLGVIVAILDNRMPNEGDGKIAADMLRAVIPDITVISLCGQKDKPEWADFHFDKSTFHYETAAKILPELINSL